MKASALSPVLIADDEPLHIEVLSNLLAGRYRIQVASTGSTALNIARGNDPPELILLHVSLPDSGGFEICRRLKEDEATQGIPIIFVTDKDSVEDEEKGFSIGASDFICKPFRPTSVRARVTNHVNLKIRSDMLQELAQVDVLSGIHNRRYFEEQYVKLWNNCLRNGYMMTLIMMDVDNFKAFNDHYGHTAGDDCLRRVAVALRGTLKRPMDLIARYGGEEFVAILPSTDEEGSQHIVEKMLQAVRDLDLPHSHSIHGKVTVSMGYAHTLPAEDMNPKELLEHADKALYQAKAMGKNQAQESNLRCNSQ